jgi:hypothetical protein
MRRNSLLASLLVLVIIAASGCAIERHRANIRDGLLIRGLHWDAFLKEWGYPNRTATITGEEAIEAGWNSYGGSFSKGRAAYDLWEYSDPAVTLVFHRQRLVSWKTDLTVQELSRNP